MFTLEIAQQSVLIKNIQDWDVTEQEGFSFGNYGSCNMALAACCERLLPKHADLNCSTSSCTNVIEKSVGVACILK